MVRWLLRITMSVAILSLAPNSARAAAFEASVLGIYEVEGSAGKERYLVLKPQQAGGDYRFFPIGLALRKQDGRDDLSVVVASSPIFDDTAAVSLTAGFEFPTSAKGLDALKGVVAKAVGQAGIRFAPLGNVDYVLYLYLAQRGVNEEGLVVKNLDSGSATVQSTIVTTFRIDSIGIDQLRNLLHGQEGRLVFVLVTSFDYEMSIVASLEQQRPADALKDLFDPTADLPLRKLYERELATSGVFDAETGLSRINDLAPIILRATPKLDVDALRADWTLNAARLDEESPKTTLTKKLPVRDLARSVFALPAICRNYKENVVDADNLGDFCD